MIPTNDDFRTASAAWKGSHRGVNYRVNWHGLSDYNASGTWCFYLYLHEEQFADPAAFAELWIEPHNIYADKPEHRPRWSYRYEDTWFANLDGWHCGVTWWDQTTHVGGLRTIEAGCDYSHLWDQESGYPDTLQSVTDDAKRAIDELLRVKPGLLLTRCSWDGTYHPEAEMVPWGSGLLWRGNIEKRNAACPDAEPIVAPEPAVA